MTKAAGAAAVARRVGKTATVTAVVSHSSLEINWALCKKVFLPYDGMASQIHILDISKTKIEKVLNIMNKTVQNPVVGLVPTGPVDPSWRLEELIVSPQQISQIPTGQTTISSRFLDTVELTFDIWAEKASPSFELEIWFWADQLFPGNEQENFQRFERLMSVIQPIVELSSGKCIATPCEASDPLEDLRKGYAVELS